VTPNLHPPKQARSRRTLNRIIAAALKLIREEGPEGTTVQAIVERAGSSVGSFYARFDGKDDLFRYLEERVWTDARERWDEALAARAWEELSLEEAVEGVVRLLLEISRTDAGVRLALAGRPGAPEVEEAAQNFKRHVRMGIREVLLSRAAQLDHPDPATAVDLAFRLIVGAAPELERARREGQPPALSEEELVAQLRLLLLAYLGAGGVARPEASGSVDFFDIWGQ